MTHDLLITGGTVVDGTGAPPRTADVAITDGVITAVGKVDGAAARTIDADGALVTPGFVDIHAHYDGQATWAERMIPSSWHGVTTVVSGNCGVGFAPVRPSDHDRLIELMEGVEDIPGVVLTEGLPWTWQSFPEFLDTLDGRAYDVDVAVHVPHGALRLHVMGERASAHEPATAEDIETMARLAAEAVRAGAIGFSTSRTLNHRTSTGEHTPTLTAGADELIAIAEAIGETGQGVLQVVSDFADADAEFDLFAAMVQRSGRPLSFSMVQLPGRTQRLLERLVEANAAGIPMRAQVAPRPVGLLLALDGTVHPFRGNAAYEALADLPRAERVARLRRPEVRAEILAAASTARPLDLSTVFELGTPPQYEPHPSQSIAARAAAQGVDPLGLAYDLLVGEDGQGILYLPLLNWTDGNLDEVRQMLAHPHTVVGLADGGAHVATICDASFPTTLLTHWGRDRDRDRLDLAHLVHRQTQATAQTVGLLDRGVLAPGYRADVNVIDFDGLANRSPRMAYDLPAGGRRLLQEADGYLATLVAGTVTYERGEATGPLPGRLLRGPRPAPAAA